MRGLRRHMRLTQDQLAEALGVRQQTVSEWETGLHRPRGASGRLLTIVAEQSDFAYGASPDAGEGGGSETLRSRDGERGEDEEVGR